MRILVIGGTRFIGPYVVRRLVSQGHDVAVFHRGETEAELPPAVAHIHGERARLAEFGDTLRRFAPDAAIDMAPYTENDARVALGALRGMARRIVALSSMDVYRAYGRFHGTEPGPAERSPLTEDSPLRERLFPYRGEGRGLDDYEKILVERAVMNDPDLAGTVLRLPMVYGPGDYQHRLFLDLKRMDDGRPAILLPEDVAGWRWTRGYVEDIAAAVVMAATDVRAAGRLYNVGEQDALTYGEWVRSLGRAAGWTGRVVSVPRERLPVHLPPPSGDYGQDLVCDTSRIREELGYAEVVPRDAGLSRATEWERANRPAGEPEWFDYEAEDAVLAELG
jgi:nucleoside-diphosphate-sugar epimerase